MQVAAAEAPTLTWWAADAPRAAPQAARFEALGPGLWAATPEGLPADGRVAYQVGDGPARTFRAGAGAPRFAVFGGTDGAAHAAVVERVAEARPDFVVHTGTMVRNPSDWLDFLRTEAPLLARAPLLAVPGDGDRGPWFDRVARRDRWAPGGAFSVRDWGGLRVVGVDSARPAAEWRAGVDAALAEARDRLLVVVLHHPPYSSGGRAPERDLRAVVGELAARHGAELVFAGRDRDYERTERIDGVTYVVTGVAGGPATRVDPRNFSKAQRTEAHYVLVDVDPGGLALRTLDLSGAIVDHVLVRPNPPREGP